MPTGSSAINELIEYVNERAHQIRTNEDNKTNEANRQMFRFAIHKNAKMFLEFIEADIIIVRKAITKSVKWSYPLIAVSAEAPDSESVASRPSSTKFPMLQDIRIRIEYYHKKSQFISFRAIIAIFYKKGDEYKWHTIQIPIYSININKFDIFGPPHLVRSAGSSHRCECGSRRTLAHPSPRPGNAPTSCACGYVPKDKKDMLRHLHSDLFRRAEVNAKTYGRIMTALHSL
jgi:hypothetical protein